MTRSPHPSEASMRARLSTLLVSTLALSAALPHASAQSARSGIRVEYTAIDTTGGLSGRAFLPMSTRDVVRGGDALTPCNGATRLRATAHQTRGAVRQISLTLVVRAPATLPIDASACPGAFVDTTLEDGTVLSGGRGEVVVSEIVLPGRVAGFVAGRFSQTAMRNGAPVTIRGEFRIPLSAPAATPIRGLAGS